MPLTTTVIGSYPKPDYLPTPDWFREGQSFLPTMVDKYKEEHKDKQEGRHAMVFLTSTCTWFKLTHVYVY